MDENSSQVSFMSFPHVKATIYSLHPEKTTGATNWVTRFVTTLKMAAKQVRRKARLPD